MMAPSPYKLSAFGGKGQTDFFGDYRPDEHETLVVDDFYEVVVHYLPSGL